FKTGTRWSPCALTAMSACQPTRPRSSDRPACWDRCTSNSRRPRMSRPLAKLKNGAVIPLSRASLYPTTEQTLASVSILLNGGGIGQLQEINQALAKAFAGRENDMRSLLG